MFAHDDAELHYRRAINLADTLDDPGSRAQAQEKLGRVLRLSARYDEALQTLEEAAAQYRSLDQVVGEGRAVAQIGRAYFDLGLNEDGARRVRPLLEDLEAREPRSDFDGVVAELAVVMAHLQSRFGAYFDSAVLAERGSERARRAGDNGLLAEAQFRRGTALSHAGDFQQGFGAMEEAIAMAEAAGDHDTESRAIGMLSLFHWDRGEVSEAKALMIRSLDLCRLINDPTQIADALGTLASVDFAQGNWESAFSYLESSEQTLHGVAASWISANNVMRRGELNLAQGQLAEGLRLVEEGRDLAERDGNIIAECEAACVLSDHALFSGDTELAKTHLQRFLDRHPADPDAPETLQTWGLALFAQVYAEMGDIATADAYLNRISDQRVVAHLDNVYSVRALVAAHKARWDEAEHYAEEALAFARRGGFIVSEARLLYVWGRWLAEKGEAERARERLEEALAIFRRLGAHPYVARIEQMLEIPAGL